MTALPKRNISQFHVIKGSAKLTRSGVIKKTHTNAKKGRSTWCDPIRDPQDIKSVISFLQEKIDKEPRADYRRGWSRNKLYFCVGIITGFRSSDLLSLQWQDVFEADGVTYRKEVGIVEKKTGKMKRLYFISSCRKYFDEYVSVWHPDTTQGYVFTNRQGKKLNRQTVDDFLKEATAALGIKGSFSTHSVRKTYAYQYYTLMTKKGDPLALPKVQAFLNHRNSATTLRYLGLEQKRQFEEMEEFSSLLEVQMG